MKVLSFVVKILALCLLLFFTLQNTHPVSFNWGPGQSLTWPLVALLWVAFVIGAIFGLFALLGRVLVLRHETGSLKKQIKALEKRLSQIPDSPPPARDPMVTPAPADASGRNDDEQQ